MTTAYNGSYTRDIGTISSGSGVVPGGYVTTGPTSYVTGPIYGNTNLGGSSYGVTTYQQGTTSTYVGQPVTTTTTYVGAPTTQTYMSGVTSGIATQQGYARVAAQDIPVQSRIQYIPFEKKYIQYDTIERIEKVPYEEQIVEYEQIVHTQKVPIERTITDYYAVQTQIEYIPKQIQETIVQYEPVERTWERVQYLPVQTQIIHYPQTQKYVAGQGGRYIQGGYTTGSQVYATTRPAATYQTYQTTTSPVYQTVYSGSQYGTTAVQPTYAYQTTIPGQATYQATTTTSQYGSASGVPGQSFTTGPLDTSTYTAGYQQGGYQQGGYQQGGYTTVKETTTVTQTGNVASGSQVKNNTSYATNI